MATFDPNERPGSLGSDLSALQDAGYDTTDAGTGNTTFNASWVGSETGSSSSEAAAAGHAARDDMADAGDMGIPADRHG